MTSGIVGVVLGAQLAEERLSAAAINAALRALQLRLEQGSVTERELAPWVMATVPTQAALTALDPTTFPGTRLVAVNVRGRTTGGDGWGGVWVWVASSALTEDGYNVLEADGGGSGRWERLVAAPEVAEAGTGWAEMADSATNENIAVGLHPRAAGYASSLAFASNTAAFSVGGLTAYQPETADEPFYPERTVVLINSSGQAMTLKHQSSGSDAANRIWLPGGADKVSAGNVVATLRYSLSMRRWVLVGWVE